MGAPFIWEMKFISKLKENPQTTQTSHSNSASESVSNLQPDKDQLKRLSKLPFKTKSKMEELKKNWAVEYSLVDWNYAWVSQILLQEIFKEGLTLSIKNDRFHGRHRFHYTQTLMDRGKKVVLFWRRLIRTFWSHDAIG